MEITEAVKLLPKGKRVHTFLGMFGADWDRIDVLKAIRKSSFRRKADTILGPHLAIEHPNDPAKTLLIEIKA